jgi:uncharacterized membrane protein YdjX (TVP38/TMEM64 family)
MNSKIKAILSILGFIIFFIFFSYLVQTNINFLKTLINENILGLVIYFLIIILAIVIAPISSIPLIPLVSNIWGWLITALVSIIGWTIGSMIAFLLARKYGVKIVNKIISLKSIQRIEKKMPEDHLFLSVILLRMIIPVDILSYALGLFSKIKFWSYSIATFIGVIPVTFLLSYSGTISFIYQIIGLVIILIISSIYLLLKKILSK